MRRMLTCTRLIFRRYTKQRLKRNSMTWTMHMCLLQPQLIGIWYNKAQNAKLCYIASNWPKLLCFIFFLSAEADVVFIKVLLNSLIKQWVCADLEKEPQSNIYVTQSWHLDKMQHSKCVIWWNISFYLHYIFVWQFGNLGLDNKDDVQMSVLTSCFFGTHFTTLTLPYFSIFCLFGVIFNHNFQINWEDGQFMTWITCDVIAYQIICLVISSCNWECD